VCGFENYQEITDREYKPLVRCASKRCIENKINGKLTFLSGHSIFKEYQELKVQETPDQLTAGKIPKNFVVHARGPNCKQAAPGDTVMVQGVLLPINKDAWRDVHNLAFTTYLEAFKITREKKKYVEMHITEEQLTKVEAIRGSLSDDDIFQKMAKSIAPEIFGLATVKKALLLLMVGGITKSTEDHLRIRGEINIALIGDPGIAKSQLLKHIAQIAPRGVYTTGKGSSGVGLTAAITVDPITREVFLEAGALVLADMGVCCIDEFDKMGEYDRTAIHEVMEQQTVSIAKAGITTSLNARASILAAANPLYGRYNSYESPHKNINLPAALLSRFDLIFILLDQANNTIDRELAVHIGRVHQNSRSPEQDTLFDAAFLRTYIALSKGYEPTITEALHKEIIERYIMKRQQQMDVTREGENYTTMRSLLGLVRLAQARVTTSLTVGPPQILQRGYTFRYPRLPRHPRSEPKMLQ
jgi:DNA replication licensing factor MCM7